MSSIIKLAQSKPLKHTRAKASNHVWLFRYFSAQILLDVVSGMDRESLLGGEEIDVTATWVLEEELQRLPDARLSRNKL